MSIYYDISLSSTTYMEIYGAIITAIDEETNVWQIVELVHLLDLWEKLKEEASVKMNKEHQRWMEQQKLFEDRKVDDIFMYHSIASVVRNSEIDLDAESEFHFICDLSDLFKKKLEETTVNE